jgi:hypothetical protein
VTGALPNAGVVWVAANRLKREFMVRCPPVRTLVRRRYAARLAHHRPRLPEPHPSDRPLVDALRAEAVALTSLDELALPGTDDLRAAAGELARGLAAVSGAGLDWVRPGTDELAGDLSIWRWGLHPRLLDIAENYFGLPVRYWGPDLRRDLANRGAVGVRQWHRDVEDHRQLKIMIWLEDVGHLDGAYEYVLRSCTEPITRALKYVSGFVTDTEIASGAARDQWQLCCGPAGTVVFTDPAGLFHRANPLATGDRYSLTFSYTSRHQLKIHPREPLSRFHLDQLRAGLDQRQLDALPPLG